MSDLILEANTLPDFLAQYFGQADRGNRPFVAQGLLCADTARRINRICNDHEGGYGRGVVVASVLAFVEMARKWDQMTRGAFAPYRVSAFLAQPPEWFDVAPMDDDLLEDFLDVPASVEMPNGETRPIEMYDAIHVATAFSRGGESRLVPSDRRIRQVPRLRGRVLGRLSDDHVRGES
jgi:predicted nucleic acid-binding protein